MNRLHALTASAFGVFSLFGLCVADAHGPSLNVTLDWLKDQINAQATNRGTGSCAGVSSLALPCPWHYEAVDFSACDVAWVFTQTSNAQRPLQRETREEITVPLWEDFSPAPFTMPGQGETWKVVIQLKDPSSQKMRLTRTFTFGTATSVQVENRSYAEIFFGIPGNDNKAMAERFAGAFSHAIQLCQGRKPKHLRPF
jgi:hypothetical protein